jgi:ERCC4-related helicase
MDELSRLEEQVIDNLGRSVNLNPNEIPALEELLAAADNVIKETKIERVLQVVEESFNGRSVLFFTEYKATQALLMSELHSRYGDGCVTFINGDGFVEGVKDAQGRASIQKEDRRRAAERLTQSSCWHL